MRSDADPCLHFLYDDSGHPVLLVVVWVDDLLVAGTRPQVDAFKKHLKLSFELDDSGPVEHFLGLYISRDRAQRAIEISQAQYCRDLLKTFGMENSKSAKTPAIPKSVLGPLDDKEQPTKEPFRRAVGGLLYLSCQTRPDIANAVRAVARWSAKPGLEHWTAVKRILRYVRGTMDYVLRYQGRVVLAGYCDADYATCPHTRRSVSGYLIQSNISPICWTSKTQSTVSLSTCEAEYRALSALGQQVIWVIRLAAGFQLQLPNVFPIFEDNQGTIQLARHPFAHGRTKHVSVKYHHVRELLANGTISIHYISTTEQLADLLTKALHGPQHTQLTMQLLHIPIITITHRGGERKESKG